MAVFYQAAPQEIIDLAERIKREHHVGLIEAGVTICWLVARNSDPAGHAITFKGWPAKALCRLNPLRDRVAGLTDCTILIDAQWWGLAPERERAAVIDHELTHINVCRYRVGNVRYDDANRPKLELRKHDFELCGFHAMVERHGVNSAEAKGFMGVQEVWVQRHFQFAGT